MNATIVKSIMERRPFLKMTDLNSASPNPSVESNWRISTEKCSFRSTSTQRQTKKSS